jgi:hypothetical protein
MLCRPSKNNIGSGNAHPTAHHLSQPLTTIGAGDDCQPQRNNNDYHLLLQVVITLLVLSLSTSIPTKYQ